MRKFVAVGFAVVLGVWVSGAGVSLAANMGAAAEVEPAEIAIIETRHGNIEIEFFNAQSKAIIQLFWARDKVPQTIIPSENLWHFPAIANQ